MKRSKPLYFLTALILSIVALVSGITISAGYDRLDALTSLERVEREHKSLWQRIFESMQNLNWADLFNKLAGVIDWEDFFSHLPANFDWAGFLNSLPADFDWSGFLSHIPENFDWENFFKGLPDNFDWSKFLQNIPEGFNWQGFFDNMPEDFNWGNFFQGLPEGFDWSNFMNNMPEDFDWNNFFGGIPDNFDWGDFLQSVPDDFDWGRFVENTPPDFDWGNVFENAPPDFDWKNFFGNVPSDFDYSKLPWADMTGDQLAEMPWDQLPYDQLGDIPFEQFSRDQLFNVPWDQFTEKDLLNFPWDKLTDEQWNMLREDPDFPWILFVGALGAGIWQYLPDGFVLPEGVVPEHDHIWSAWIVIEPTCTEYGRKYRQCTVSGCKEENEDTTYGKKLIPHIFDVNSICERCHRRRLVITSHGTPQGGILYDGDVHMVEGYDIDYANSALLSAHHVRVSGYLNNAVNAGIHQNTFSVTVLDANGNVVSTEYAIEKHFGNIVINPRRLVIKTDDVEKTYDGSSFSVEDLGEPHIIGGDGLLEGHELYAFEFDIRDIVLGSWQNSLLYVRIGPPDSAGGHIDMTKNYAIECIAGDLHIYRE